MSALIRMDSTGHTTVAEWTAEDAVAVDAAEAVFRTELERGYFGIVSHPDGRTEHVRELPVDARLVILRRPIAGG